MIIPNNDKLQLIYYIEQKIRINWSDTNNYSNGTRGNLAVSDEFSLNKKDKDKSPQQKQISLVKSILKVC